jgi:hypothetical protein
MKADGKERKKAENEMKFEKSFLVPRGIFVFNQLTNNKRCFSNPGTLTQIPFGCQ